MTRPAVEARRATPADVDDLLLMWTRAREELGRTARPPYAVTPDQFRARLEEALGGQELIILIGRYEGGAAGYAVLRLAPVLLVDGDALHIEHLFVLPSVRHRGVARALLMLATSVAERHGADQIMAGAAPSARDTHRFLARLGFSPLVVRRVVGTSALRRRLAGEGPRRGLEDLLSRRRSMRARSLRSGWAERRDEPDDDPDDDPAEVAELAAPPVPDGDTFPGLPAEAADRPAPAEEPGEGHGDGQGDGEGAGPAPGRAGRGPAGGRAARRRVSVVPQRRPEPGSPPEPADPNVISLVDRAAQRIDLGELTEPGADGGPAARGRPSG